MSDIAIKVENLSKRYVINHQRASGDGLRHALQDKLTAPFRNLKEKFHRNPSSTSSFLPSTLERASTEQFFALKDVSFDIKQGEVVGIIGRNGAGKSTLLKILSRITEPTSGRITINGRVASLLEVGTGFHPELTGRENIFLNGAILGMSRVEIKAKFDEIVAFAEVERFLDTPVKRYSSGMYVRLAFAVAAHLNPEILIVDEVLAVGDAQFQSKCLEKMRETGKSGSTVLLVSHNLTMLTSLCSSGILLYQGRVLERGSTSHVLSHYLSSGADESGNWTRRGTVPQGDIYFESVNLTDHTGITKGEFDFRDEVRINLRAVVRRPLENAQLAIRVTNQEAVPVFTTCNTDEAQQFIAFSAGLASYSIRIPGRLLSPGRYTMKVAAHVPKGTLFDLIEDEVSFVIHETGSNAALLKDDRIGVVNPLIQWRLAP